MLGVAANISHFNSAFERVVLKKAFSVNVRELIGVCLCFTAADCWTHPAM